MKLEYLLEWLKTTKDMIQAVKTHGNQYQKDTQLPQLIRQESYIKTEIQRIKSEQ